MVEIYYYTIARDILGFLDVVVVYIFIISTARYNLDLREYLAIERYIIYIIILYIVAVRKN